MALDKAALLRKPELRRMLVNIGSGEVWMREFSVGEQQRLRAKYKHDNDEAAALNASLCLIGHALCNEDGSPMLDESEIPEFAKALEESPQDRVAAMVKGFQEVVGLGEAALRESLGN